MFTLCLQEHAFEDSRKERAFVHRVVCIQLLAAHENNRQRANLKGMTKILLLPLSMFSLVCLECLVIPYGLECLVFTPVTFNL